MRPEQSSPKWWHRLKKVMSTYLSSKNQEELATAYHFARKLYQDKHRISGEGLIDHVTRVALVLSRMQLDLTTLIACLLHEGIDLGQTTYEEIQELYGEEIAFMVLSLSVVKDLSKSIGGSKTPFGEIAQLLVSATQDIRVLIIRLANKLVDLETVDFLTPEAQKHLVERTERIYAPLAELIGLYQFRRQFDDMCFKWRHPKEYKDIQSYLDKYYDLAQVEELVTSIKRLLKINSISYAKIYGRYKGFYSTYQKLLHYQRIGKIAHDDPDPLSKIWDKVGLTVLTSQIADCYLTLGLIMSKFETVNEEFDDYISHPKKNGYQGLQIPIRIETKKGAVYVEIQIKTLIMHENNEFGTAAHFMYKTKTERSLPKLAKELHKWRESDDNQQRWSIDILKDKIFVFTKDGDIIALSKGATPIDFAYALHSDVGDHCRGALINDKISPLSRKLNTGDVVTILEGKKKMVNKGWLELAVTDRARRKIRKVVV